jgi:glycosyltransferase involved in cell wall biosynthesis
MVYSGPSTGWLARTWLEQGHRITVFALSSEAGTRQVLGEADPLQVVVVPQRPRHRARDFFRAERIALTAAMRDHRVDVVSAHWTYEFALAAESSGLPAYVTARDTPLRYAWEMGTAWRWVHNSLALPAVHRATALSAISPYAARHLRRCLGVRRSIRVIPNGVRLDDLPLAGPPRSATRAPVFASALHGWGPLKNGTSLLQAFGLVRERMKNARLVMFGDGFSTAGPAEQWAIKQGLFEGVEFAGPTDRSAILERVAREADVLVHPSRVEAFSMIVAEAMAIGVPVIAGARSGAVPWLLDGGHCGVLTDIDAPAKLADAMGTLAHDQERRCALAQAARQRVSDHFQLQDVAREYAAWLATH